MNTAITLLSKLRIDPDLQPRGGHDLETVGQYAEAMLNGATFPPLLAMWDGEALWMYDGFHRYYAYHEAGIEEAPVTFENGSKRDAFIRSLGTNATHGQPRSYVEKREYVGKALADAELAKKSDREIARMCNVSHTFVSELRPTQRISAERAMAKHRPRPEKEPSKGKTQTFSNGASGSAATDDSAAAAAEFTERIAILAEDNDRLNDRLAAAAMPDVTEEERTLAFESLQGLRAELKTVRAELAAVKASRDSYISENAQLKDQIRRDRRAIDRFKEQGVSKRAKQHAKDD